MGLGAHLGACAPLGEAVSIPGHSCFRRSKELTPDRGDPISPMDKAVGDESHHACLMQFSGSVGLFFRFLCFV